MRLLLFLLLSISLIHCKQSTIDLQSNADATTESLSKELQLIHDAVAAVGGIDAFKAKKDVEYSYEYKTRGKSDVYLERYIIDGELSWAEMQKHELTEPERTGKIIQGFDGVNSWVKYEDGSKPDSSAIGRADFVRQTNYYWFAMMYKLLDPGMTYKYEGIREVGDVDYEVVRVGFEKGVGDVQDDYVLYIHPKTKLVDQFLFTVKDFGVTDPLLMRVKYEEVEGLKLMTYRDYVPSDWNGNEKGEVVAEQISTNIKFNNGFDASIFQTPE